MFIMTTLKKSKAIIAAILVAATMLVCAMPAYATTKTEALTIGLYKATCTLNSSDQKHGDASTTSTTKKWDTIYAGIIGRRVDSKRDLVKIVSAGDTAYNSKDPGTFSIFIESSSSDYFEKITSVHAISSGSSEKGTTLLIEYKK